MLVLEYVQVSVAGPESGRRVIQNPGLRGQAKLKY